MAKLPSHELCVVPDAKLSRYLLALDHPEGGPKAKFLARFGFDASSTELLKAAIIEHAAVNDVVDMRQNAFGTTYGVDGPLVTPDGRNPVVRVVWMIDTGTSGPRLITLVPE